MAVAVRVAIVKFAAFAPIISDEFVPCNNSPVPASAVLLVKVPLLVSVTLITVTLGMARIPDSACELMSNVCTPLPALKVPVALFVIPPRKVTAEFPRVLAHVAPGLIVTKPAKSLVPVAELMFSVPLSPPPTVVAPVTVKLKPAEPNVVLSPTTRSAPMVKATPFVAPAVPLKVTLPVTFVRATNGATAAPLKVRSAPTFVTPVKVFVPLPDRVKFW